MICEKHNEKYDARKSECSKCRNERDQQREQKQIGQKQDWENTSQRLNLIIKEKDLAQMLNDKQNRNQRQLIEDATIYDVLQRNMTNWKTEDSVLKVLEEAKDKHHVFYEIGKMVEKLQREQTDVLYNKMKEEDKNE